MRRLLLLAQVALASGDAITTPLLAVPVALYALLLVLVVGACTSVSEIARR